MTKCGRRFKSLLAHFTVEARTIAAKQAIN
jgi:hypothetical protein